MYYVPSWPVILFNFKTYKTSDIPTTVELRLSAVNWVISQVEFNWKYESGKILHKKMTKVHNSWMQNDKMS